MKKAAYHFLRVGLAITFLWIGILIFRDPEGWGSFLQPWAVALLPVPVVTAMFATAALDVLVGFFLLIDSWVYIAAFLGALHIAVVIITVGLDEITVRDLGLFFGAVALLIESFPLGILARFRTKNNFHKN